MLISQRLFSEAKQLLPGGVNSPVRSFAKVGGQPLFIKRAKGAFLFDDVAVLTFKLTFAELINCFGTSGAFLLCRELPLEGEFGIPGAERFVVLFVVTVLVDLNFS